MLEEVSRSKVKLWLENYHGTDCSSLHPTRTFSETEQRKSFVDRSEVKVMIDQACNDMPNELRTAVAVRWFHQYGEDMAIQLLQCSASTYYRRCNKAVDFIQEHINTNHGFLTP